MKFYFEHKEKGIAYLAEFLAIDGQTRSMPMRPMQNGSIKFLDLKLRGIRSTIEAIKKTTPKAAAADPGSFIDSSLIDQLVKEGYIK